MNRVLTRPAAALLGVFFAAGATAQSARDADTDPPRPTPPNVVLSDAQPLPAEDRSSTGAVVLQNSLVRAQRSNAFNAAGERTGVISVGRNVARVLGQAPAEAGLAATHPDNSGTQ